MQPSQTDTERYWYYVANGVDEEQVPDVDEAMLNELQPSDMPELRPVRDNIRKMLPQVIGGRGARWPSNLVSPLTLCAPQSTKDIASDPEMFQLMQSLVRFLLQKILLNSALVLCFSNPFCVCVCV